MLFKQAPQTQLEVEHMHVYVIFKFLFVCGKCSKKSIFRA